MTSFDNLMNLMDDVQQDTFGIEVLINGQTVKGVFDEVTDYFGGVEVMNRSLDIPESDLPSNIIPDSTTVKLMCDGRTFTIRTMNLVGNQYVLELYD